MVSKNPEKCFFCNKKKFISKFKYNSPPVGEIDFEINPKKYKRKLVSCVECNHWYACHKINLKNLYSGTYNKMIYKNKLKEKFLKIISLPKRKSDNYSRVKRIIEFKKFNFGKKKNLNLLDIGSGLGVFPYKIKKNGINCTSIDPDINSVKHIQKNLKINAIHGNYNYLNFNKKFNIVTLNKVLEHVSNPIKMLKKVKKNLKNLNIVYIEVPDAEKAAKIGKKREEFFIDHLHVFSKRSLELMCIKSGFKILKIQRLKEASGKYTLFCFIKNNIKN